MGVPAFYRWLVEKYPKVVESAIEEKDCVNSSLPNPNGKEFDNLYLDMNGIIHTCFHPEDQINGPTNFKEVFSLIFGCIDGLFTIVRPRKLLYMAIDGVAPRAKMNQQRTRRFRTARDAEIAETEEGRLRKEFERSGKEVLPKEESELFDSNIITPGTVFMHKLAVALEGYIRDRINNDPGWKSIKVILSDSSVPGEGEHKIMSFIRLQRSSPGYNPETRHCLYGLDADLIMLALATHEVNFSILREDILIRGHDYAVSSICSRFSETELEPVKSRQWFTINLKKPYQFVNIWTLREYLMIDMSSDANFEIDAERIVDDFIFICFFTGNDFLPQMPTLEIHEGCLDLLIHVYKRNFSANGYLIDMSRINEEKAACMKMKWIEKFILEVGTYEDKIFRKRYNIKQANMRKFLSQVEREEKEHCDDIDQPDDNEHIDFCHNKGKNDISVSCSTSAISEKENISEVIANTNELKQKLKNVIQSKSDLYKNGIFDNDKVKLGCDGWKTRYYNEKFLAENQIEVEFKRKEIVEKYMEGLCWTLNYYFSGVCSWSWYYPFHYGPFASDMKGLSCPSSVFKIGEPFKPYNQLMAVLPPRSSNALPKSYMNLMKSEDSPLIDFYQKDFEVDTNGKRFVWQGVCKLPFIDEEKLLAATKNLENDLKFDEVARNSIGKDRIFVRDCHGLGLKIASVQTQTMLLAVDTNSCELYGYISLCCKSYSAMNYGTGNEDHTLSANFDNPDDCLHVPRLIVSDVSQLPEMKIKREDIVERRLWHEREKPHHQFITNRYIPRNVDPPRRSEHGMDLGVASGYQPPDRNSSSIWSRGRGSGRNVDPPKQSVSNEHETHLGIGSGWGGRGRGRINYDASSSGILHDKNRVVDQYEAYRPLDRNSSGVWSRGRGSGHNGPRSLNQRDGSSTYLNNRYSSQKNSGDRW